MVLKLKDGRKELYQWDVGVVADVTDENINEVHFSNLRYGVSFNVGVQNGTVTIPPEVLQSGAGVFCWAFVRRENGGYTKKEQVFNVEKRPRPADYIYKPTDVLTWEALKQQIEEVETALNGKVNKSDVLSNIDKNAQPEDIYNAPAVNIALADIEKGTIKVLPSGEVKLWELQSGLYGVSSGVTIKASTTKSLPQNAKPYSYLYVSGKFYTGSTDQRYVVGWAYLVSELYNGYSDTKVYTGSTYENGIEKEPAAELATVTKLNNLEERLNAKLKDVATKDYVNEAINALQGNLDTVSALVGGA